MVNRTARHHNSLKTNWTSSLPNPTTITVCCHKTKQKGPRLQPRRNEPNRNGQSPSSANQKIVMNIIKHFFPRWPYSKHISVMVIIETFALTTAITTSFCDGHNQNFLCDDHNAFDVECCHCPDSKKQTKTDFRLKLEFNKEPKQVNFLTSDHKFLTTIIK